ncbi:threonine/serine dehydratase [Phytohabitans sp. ZYX-F-186]|uniref:Threonine/serine dehydratase n=1 Tax=Phytohabitans maris TaxID=3071409 RepID=A0ABU0ZNY0_9ACTN|nr:threonine/serine dehydratase [Phytohabitans sp. ZYX-F-186]MDQ7908749.1 threonine/serine dehydratase [Phytohabitans sp. ZYX-F-186]
MDIESIRTAASIIEGVAARTPMLSKTGLDEIVGTELYVKCENLQHGGSFKLRGAYTQMARLTEAERRKGVVTYSSGNHGIGVALAGHLLGIDVVVFLPDDVSPTKRQGIESLGATIVEYDPRTRDRDELLLEPAAVGRTPVPPYDNANAIAGQGTVGLEIATQAADADVVLVPVGGGGLIAGIAVAVKAMLPGVTVIGVEPAGADDTRQSRSSGKRVRINHPTTVVDSLRTPTPGRLTFPIVQNLVDDIVTVEDSTVLSAMTDLFNVCHIVAEPGGAVGLAAIQEGKIDTAGKKVCTVVSGGNISARSFMEVIHHGAGQTPAVSAAPADGAKREEARNERDLVL